MPTAQEVDQVIDQTYDCLINDEGWKPLLSAYVRLVGGDSGVIYVKPRSVTSGRAVTAVGIDPGGLETYFSYYEARSPLMARFRRQPEGQVSALGEYAFSNAYRETEFFQDWVRPQRYADMLGAHLVRSPLVYAWLSIRRSEDHGVYSPHELRVANRVARHLARVIQLWFHRESEREIAQNVRDTLDETAFGLLIVDSKGKVQMANQAANDILRAGDGLALHHGRLVCSRPEETSAMEAAIRGSAHGRSGNDLVVRDFCLSRRSTDSALRVHVIPIHSSSTWSRSAPSCGAAAIFIADPLANAANVNGFAKAYRLTAAERNVLREVVKCGGLIEAAHNLGVKLPTARTHLQRIFEKTEVNSQTELIRLVMTLPLRIRE